MTRRTWNRLISVAAAVSALAVALPVSAHPGDHTHERLMHLLTEPDHLAMVMLLGLVCAAAFAPRLARAVARLKGRR